LTVALSLPGAASALSRQTAAASADSTEERLGTGQKKIRSYFAQGFKFAELGDI
jgi:hypothetical protein